MVQEVLHHLEYAIIHISAQYFISSRIKNGTGIIDNVIGIGNITPPLP